METSLATSTSQVNTRQVSSRKETPVSQHGIFSIDHWWRTYCTHSLISRLATTISLPLIGVLALCYKKVVFWLNFGHAAPKRSATTDLDEKAYQLHVTTNTELHVYGDHETQVSEGGEADLHKHFDDCKKNPGHAKFIPVKTFRIEDLPEDYRDHDLYRLIKSTADLTVRVAVKMTSPHRPEFYPGTTVLYPFYNMRDKTTLRLGTGQIAVMMYTDGRGIDAAGAEFNAKGRKSIKTCPCKKCQDSGEPKNVWWEIILSTATHVVFDDIEARNTSCRMFYDGQDSPMVSLDKFSEYFVDVERDWCRLKYVTCDPLGETLYNMEVDCQDHWWKVLNKYENTHNVPLNFIVSHPHGCHKQVSVGHLLDNYKVSEYNNSYNRTKLTYTTCTCPGSSGAAVNCVGSSNGHCHSGAFDSGLNYSSEGLYRK